MKPTVLIVAVLAGAALLFGGLYLQAAYNRYELHTDGFRGGYKLDKRTGQTWMIGKTKETALAPDRAAGLQAWLARQEAYNALAREKKQQVLKTVEAWTTDPQFLHLAPTLQEQTLANYLRTLSRQ